MTNFPWGPYPPNNRNYDQERLPNTSFPRTNIVEIPSEDGAHNFRTPTKITVLACTGKCAISFSDACTVPGAADYNYSLPGGAPLTRIPGIRSLPQIFIKGPF